MKKIISYSVIDFSLYIFSFLLIFHLRRGVLFFDKISLSILFYYFIAWMLSLLITRKVQYIIQKDLKNSLRQFAISFFIMIGILGAILIFVKESQASRLIIAGSLLMGFAIEIIVLFLKVSPQTKKKSHLEFIKFKRYFFVDLSTFICVLSLYSFLKIDIRTTSGLYFLILIGLLVIWLTASILSHNFDVHKNANYWQFTWKTFKADFLIFSMSLFFIFLLHIDDGLRNTFISLLIFYFIFALIILSYYYFSIIPKDSDEVRLNLLKVNLISDAIINIEKLPKYKQYSITEENFGILSIYEKLKNVYLKKFPELFEKINEKINLNSIAINRSMVIRSSDAYNVEILPYDCFSMFLNLHELNDIRRLNAYLIEIHRRLHQGGVFIGKFESIKFRQQRFLRKYPFLLAEILYFSDFLWRRVAPKLPIIQKFYFGLTKGKGRALSLAEGLGRLYYCGFNVPNIFELDGFIHFIAVKTKEPSSDKNPSYGPFFKMKRIGKEGKPIFVYKLRTMHPYSEYLHDYVIKNFGYADIGKPADDFRVTAWGKFLRKYWIDELPQLINVLRGDMKLVGIRPISQTFLNEFPEDIILTRNKYKPGCIPAYVSLLKQSKEGFIEAETIYLREKVQHPIATDIKFFYKALYNIITNQIRSS